MPTWVLVQWANKQARVELEIDASNRVTFVRRIGARGATCTISLPDGSRSRTLPSSLTELTVPTGATARIQLTFDATRNRWSGIAGQVIDE